MDIEIEAVAERSGHSRYERWLAVLVGATAVAAALITALQVDAGKQEERALLLASRLTVQVFGGTAALGAYSDFQAGVVYDVLELGASQPARALTALQRPAVAEVQEALAAADAEAARRLAEIGDRMALPPGDASGVDERTRALVTLSGDTLLAMSNEQRRQVELAERYGFRQTLTVFALSLLALAGVLVGLGAVFREGLVGRLSLSAATLTVLISLALGGSSLAI